MIDIETLSTKPDGAILSIGACAFDMTQVQDFDDITDKFYRTISIESNMKYGRHIEAGTLEWWFKQDKAALSALFEPPPGNLKHALRDLCAWMSNLSPQANRVWANDPDFDIVMLKAACDAVGQIWPMRYHMNRSLRTIKDLAWPDDDAPNLRGDSVHHRADDDCVVQALYVQQGYRKILMQDF